MWGYLQKSKMLAAPCQKLFETMVYHTDRARRLALTSPLLLPERVPVVFSIRLFDPPLKRRGFFLVGGMGPKGAFACAHTCCAATAGRLFRPSRRGSASFRSTHALRLCRRA